MQQQYSARDRLRMAAALLAAITSSACGGGGGSGGGGGGGSPPSPPANPPPPPEPALRDVYEASFLVGAAVQSTQMTHPDDGPLIRKHFSSVTAEYEMKADQIAPFELSRDFSRADAIVDNAEANDIHVRGHALVWHQTTPSWFLSGSAGDIRAKLEAYVTEVVTRYAGRIYAWDVVNEVASDTPGGDLASSYRQSNWLGAVGPDYIEWAFRAARAADPSCQLFLNDYQTESAGKRANVMRIVDDLLAKGVPIDGVGHQCHLSNTPNYAPLVDNIEAALNATEMRGLLNHVTEVDVSMYNDPGSCYSSQTGCQPDLGPSPGQAVFSQQARVYRELFARCAAKPSVTSLTLWGVQDGQSWLNGFPVTRTNHPLLFDRQRRPKTAYYAVADPAYAIP